MELQTPVAWRAEARVDTGKMVVPIGELRCLLTWGPLTTSGHAKARDFRLQGRSGAWCLQVPSKSFPNNGPQRTTSRTL
jgi:hypothetical protein